MMEQGVRTNIPMQRRQIEWGWKVRGHEKETNGWMMEKV
jgi:hypothetical protein